MAKLDVLLRQQRLLMRSAQLRAALGQQTRAIETPVHSVARALVWGQRLWRVWRLWGDWQRFRRS